ncbi:aldo/keto reductase [Patescibacteria group bacterium]|nr:aldo/keto reductase [Patescibacteria group bacterium]
MKKLRLNAQAEIPILGLGTWQLSGSECQSAVEEALKIGYRHIDSADGYGNHQELAAAIKNSGLKRDELFITSKIPAIHLEHQEVLDSAHRYLEELQTNYLNLLLIHWPNSSIPIKDTLSAFAQLKDEGVIRAIGVSNFTIPRLEEALATNVEITNNQVEFHPSLNQADLKEFCDQHQIVVTAYSPVGRGEDLDLPVILELAKKYEKTPSQIVLNWLISQDIVAIPKSANPKHIQENFASTEFALSAEDVAAISHLDGHNRLVNPGFADFNS